MLRDTGPETSLLYSGPWSKGQILSVKIPTARNSMGQPLMPEHEKQECSCSETKHSGSSVPKSNKEGTWLRNTKPKIKWAKSGKNHFLCLEKDEGTEVSRFFSLFTSFLA